MSNNCNQIKKSPANQACCPTSKVIVTEGCMDFDDITSTPITIWTSPNSYMSWTFFTNPEETSPANIVTINKGAPDNTPGIQPGTAVARIYRGVTSITLTSSGPGETTGGRFCYKIYKPITL